MLLVATKKVSVTLDESAIERARDLAGPRGLSSYLDTALQEKLERDDRRQAFRQWLAELNAADPPTADEKRQAEERTARLIAAIEQ